MHLLDGRRDAAARSFTRTSSTPPSKVSVAAQPRAPLKLEVRAPKEPLRHEAATAGGSPASSDSTTTGFSRPLSAKA